MNYSLLVLSVFVYLALILALVHLCRKYIGILIEVARNSERSLFLRDIGLISKTKFRQSMDTILSSGDPNKSLAVMAIRIVDADGVDGKTVFDDLMLAEVINRVRSAVRSSDLIYQHDDNEFIVLFHRNSANSGAKTLAQRIVSYFNEPVKMASGDIKNYSCFVGVDTPVSILLDEKENIVDKMVSHAQSALETASKEELQVHIYSENPDRYNSVVSISDIEYGFQSGHFHLAYQPQLDVLSNQTVGVEALIRWVHPVYGHVSPVDFIPLAERSKLIIPIGDWVLRQACLDYVSWGRSDITLAVNISPVHFLVDDIVDRIHKICLETEMPMHKLKIELTETSAVGDIEKSLTKLRDLSDLGIKLVIDDFGKGYSSLSYLKKFPVDTIKIDSYFVWDIGKNAYGEAIIRSITTMARDLGILTVAEGVETSKQIEYLESVGVNHLQGYHVGYPLVSDEFLRQLDRDGFRLPCTTTA